MSNVGSVSNTGSTNGGVSSSTSESDSDNNTSSLSDNNRTTIESISDSDTTEDRLSSGQGTQERLGATAANEDNNDNTKRSNFDSTPPAVGLTVAVGTVVKDAGTTTLINNPEIIKTWESTTSAWTGKDGFTDGAIAKLEDAGINVNSSVNPTPAGSIAKTPGITPGSVTTHNGNLARDAIANRETVDGLMARTEVHFDADYNRMPAGSVNTAGSRHVDVEVERPHATDPRLNQVEHIESKAMRVSAGDVKDAQLSHDAGMLRNNRAIRAGGVALENAGKVARPVGMVVDAVSVVGAIGRDGGIGEETGRTITGIAGGAAGGFAGAKAGAAFGAVVGSVVPGVGTAAGAVVGGIVGGIAGAIGGENIAKGAFNAVKGWFD